MQARAEGEFSRRTHPRAPRPNRSAAAAIRGEDPGLRRALQIAERAAASDFSVLILGETGTGKELFARAVHEASRRADRPFVALNCGAIPSELIESELFGHERGAFTGAHTQRGGAFAEADEGTLFLDEIGELPASQQPRLLRALESGAVRRVGSAGERRVDIRFVAATHRDGALGTARSPLRLDLYHRLATVVVELPPLRERRGDIPLLARAFLRDLEPDFGPRRIGEEAMEALLGHDWPGNIRELQNAVRRAVLLCDDVLTPQALLPWPDRSSRAPFRAPAVLAEEGERKPIGSVGAEGQGPSLAREAAAEPQARASPCLTRAKAADARASAIPLVGSGDVDPPAAHGHPAAGGDPAAREDPAARGPRATARGPAPDEGDTGRSSPSPRRDEAELRAAMTAAYARMGTVRGAARALEMPKSTFAERARRFGIL